MSEEFVKNFAEFANKIPFVEEGKMVSLTFSIIYGKEKPGQRNVLMTIYETPKTQLEIFVQSPKEIALEGVDEKKLRSVSIGGKKFYTNYNPNLNDFIAVEGDFYTIVKGEVLTVISPDKNILKLVKPDKSLKFHKDLLSYSKKFVKDIDGFSLCMVSWGKEGVMDRSRMIFFSVSDQTEIVVDVLSADKQGIKNLWEEIKGKKKLNGTLYKGKMEKDNVVCSILDDNRIFVSKCTKGKEKLLPEVITQIIRAVK